MLSKNDLIEYLHPRPRTVRILWLDVTQDVAYTYELDANAAMPERTSVRSLMSDLAQLDALRVEHDTYAAAPGRTDLPAKHLALRDKAWQILNGLPLEEEALYQPRVRGALITRQSVAHGVSYPTVYRYLRRYWERGQHIDALLPDYCNSGAPGKTRRANVDVKRGRPRKCGDGTGLNADPAIRLTFHAAVKRYVERHAAFCRRAAYRQMIAEFFQEREVNALPSFGQFNYWIEKDACLINYTASQQNSPAELGA